ncbi:MAG: SMC-Scp complex subunit ScpB [Acidimicrobiia bacterium]|nr:SMC-Scp complex subunit ScpB [Acidimicrobiia bacterium]MYI18999.1 SMC-Scp complex subunit ScpB [Acidimicrobiia bacterium]
MDTERRRALEAVLMVTTEPVPPQLLAQLLEISLAGVEAALADLAEQCAGRGFVLERVAGGYRFASHPDCAPYVERFVLAREPTRLSGAALETLGIIAYKQPVSRAQIAAIRGVNVDGVVRTLQRRGLVCEVARDPGPGNAVLFGTTGLFLEGLGLDSLSDLPPLGDFVPDAEVTEALDASLRSGERPRQAPVPEEAADHPGPESAGGGPGEEQPAPDRPA